MAKWQNEGTAVSSNEELIPPSTRHSKPQHTTHDMHTTGKTSNQQSTLKEAFDVVKTNAQKDRDTGEQLELGQTSSSGNDPSKQKEARQEQKKKGSQSDEPVPSLPLLSFEGDAMAPDPP